MILYLPFEKSLNTGEITLAVFLISFTESKYSLEAKLIIVFDFKDLRCLIISLQIS